MFVVIYRFVVHPGQESPFEDAWRAMTELIRDHRDSLGSRLHRSANEGEFIAYAQWKSREDWKAPGSEAFQKLATPVGLAMGAACSINEVIHELEVIDDLLISS